MDAGHLAVMFAGSVARHGELPATRVRVDGEFVVQTYAELGAQVRQLAARLIDRGLAPGDRVAIFSTNRPEWSLADLACATAALVSVPLYPTSTPEQVRHIIRDAGATVAFVAGQAEIDKLTEAGLDDVAVISFDELDGVTGLSDELAAAPSDFTAVEERLAAARADDLATIIYTSGTTGEPKGVMLTHRGFTHQVAVLNRYFTITPKDSSLCFLPLSHALERAWTYVVLADGCLNTYVPDPRTVAEMMVAAKPTLLASVPRLFEKVFITAQEKVADSPLKKRILAWALRTGSAYHDVLRAGKHPAPLLTLKLKIADKLALGAVRDAMGGPKVVLACGGAPLRTEIEEFFYGCGLLVLQGYGLTEASPLVTFPSSASIRFGTVGKVMDGGELRVSDSGQIEYRGPNLMTGYWGKPEETATTIVDGWLQTGDVGTLDEDGFLQITDRIKNLIVTSNGKNVAPAPIEGLLASDPLFEYTLVLGDNRPYLTLLVAPSLPHLEDIAHQLQVSWSKREELLNNQQVLDEIRRRVSELTAKLPKHEQIRDLRLLIEGFTQENGLLTPSLKVKRREVEQRFSALVEDMYNRAGKFLKR
ncbi:long-chain acyl-CoA synthetase [Propionicimonas paludicola]|uniref:Acyl-CoA synthetase n=1 Tax=Propionicimonas paludicola TaxID=185243 RepID=A0A2A9CV32_9ACTN|nr:long-chain fatty acid--CoA ligase [Propionicimonas paludicola]PFG18258.1 long-chain acyl-CoA synthetase [Propionicimonas paludicola]